MSDWSVGGIGGNVKAAAFEGAALNAMNLLGLPDPIKEFFIRQHKELTSAQPIIPELAASIQAGVSTNTVDAPSIPNLSKGGVSLA